MKRQGVSFTIAKKRNTRTVLSYHAMILVGMVWLDRKSVV